MKTPAGIYPMLYALFDARGALDRDAMRRQVQACVDNGAHGVAVLGLATEVGKLTDSERHALVEWVAEDLAGKLPFAVTVTGASAEAQVAFAAHARSNGAGWVILQPPRKDIGELELMRFFGAVMERLDLPAAIQNAPEYLGVGLSPDGIAGLARNHANFTVLKGEGPALLIRRVIERTTGRLAVFNGRGGLELTDNLRAGCAGIIPGTDFFDYEARVYEAMRAADEDRAEAIYRDVLPAIVFAMQSVDHLVCYGKRIAAARLGIGPVYDREPGLRPTDFGIACAQRYAARLGALA
jgi:4-hydroxy-tetrahydrodipicolinate synthase